MKNPFPLIGSLPKIGIRPAIDGRRKGVRESLEKQTMGMAKTAAKFFPSNLRYPNGRPVECVIADTCIGGVAEAAACAEKFAREGVGVVAHRHAVLVLRHRDDGHGPADSEGGVGFQRHRAARRGLSGRGAGRPQPEGPARVRHLRPRRAGRRRHRPFPPTCPRKILRFARAGLAVADDARQIAISRMGGVSMGIAGSIVDQPISSRATSACGSRRLT